MSSQDEVKIRITMDGPYQVSPEIPLNRVSIRTDSDGMSEAWEESGRYANPEPGEPYYLCRCGQSRDKPFCDGTHEDVCFCGGEKAERPSYAENAENLKGDGLGLMDDESLCVGARFCDRGDTVWKLIEEAADPEKRKQAIAEAFACPGGRLTITDKNGKPMEPDLPKEISVIEDPSIPCRGPLWVKGGIPVEGARGEAYETRNRVALCRCGESSNQPYCDASHYHCPHMEGLDG